MLYLLQIAHTLSEYQIAVLVEVTLAKYHSHDFQLL